MVAAISQEKEIFASLLLSPFPPCALPSLPPLLFMLLSLLFIAAAPAFLLSFLPFPFWIFIFLSLSCTSSSDTLSCGSRSRQLSVYCKTARQKDFTSCEWQLFPNEMLTWCFTQASSPLWGSSMMDEQPGRLVYFHLDPWERIVKPGVMAPSGSTDHTSGHSPGRCWADSCVAWYQNAWAFVSWFIS